MTYNPHAASRPWKCPWCRERVALRFRVIKRDTGDMIRYRCVNCSKKTEVPATQEELLTLLPKGFRSRKSQTFMQKLHNRRARLALQRLFVRELAEFDYLAEVARKEGGWRGR